MVCREGYEECIDDDGGFKVVDDGFSIEEVVGGTEEVPVEETVPR